MPSQIRRFAVAGLAAVAVIGAFALPAEAKTPKFKPSFVVKLPGEPKGAAVCKAAAKGLYGPALGYLYNDGVGALTLNGAAGKPGLTTTYLSMSVNVFGGMDLTDVVFPVTRPALVVLSYTKTIIKLSDPSNPKITSYNYSSDQVGGCNVTVTSYDPVKGEMKGTLDGTVIYHQNEQDPKDDARDGKIVTLKGAKFALKLLGS